MRAEANAQVVQSHIPVQYLQTMTSFDVGDSLRARSLAVVMLGGLYGYLLEEVSDLQHQVAALMIIT